VAITVKDLDKSIDFYKEIFGLEEVKRFMTDDKKKEVAFLKAENIQLETVEDIFEVIENIITKVRESDKDRLVTVVVDSVAAATTKVEQADDYDQTGWATQKAIILSKAMRKITQMIGRQRVCLVFTNQLRVKLGAMFGDPYTTSGGKAIGFHASCRLRLKAAGQIKIKIAGKDQVIGIKTKAQVVKNRMGPPLRTAEFNILFDSGIDDYGSWLQIMKDNNLVTQGGSWYTYTDTITGEVDCVHPPGSLEAVKYE